jgi:hypothetical protein
LGSKGGGFTNRLILSGLLLGIPFFFFFLLIPLIPFLGRERKISRCPACGWETVGNEKYCPYDGTRLEMKE